MRRVQPWLLLACWGCGGQPASTPIQVAAEALARQICQHPDLDNLLAPSFRQAVPLASVAAICRTHHERLGAVRSVQWQADRSAWKGQATFTFADGTALPVELEIEASPPHRITGLLFRAPLSPQDTWVSLREELNSLPGEVAALVCRLDPQPTPLLSIHKDEPRAIGSVFKLLVLRTLAEAVEQGQTSWDAVLRLRPELRSLPSGMVQDWPDGSPVTVHTLATLMIARSDNTAADHLIALLGRSRLESAWPRQRPFLTTAEMFKLKLVQSPAHAAAFASASSVERRRQLDALASVPLIQPRPPGERPIHIDSIEWFATAEELVSLLSDLRQRALATPRAMLGMVRPFAVNETAWNYVGYKGGAETGVLALTLLLQHTRGDWFALALLWNDRERALDQPRLSGLAARIVGHLERLTADR